MTRNKLIATVRTALIFAIAVLSPLACDKAEEPKPWDDSIVGTATLSGKVTDTFGTPLADVQVSCMGTNLQHELRASAVSASDGSFEVKDVPSNARYITFVKEGYASVAYTIQAERFITEDVINLNPALEFSMARITGTIYDAATGKPMSGVVVSNGVVSSTTGEDGVYSLEGLTIKPYELRYVTADGSEYNRSLSSTEFVDGVATISDLRLGGDEVWPGRRWQQLADAPVWYGNEFRGSTGFSGRNDWSSGYMSSWSYYGQYRYEAEGCAFVTDISYGKQGETDRFNAYVYGRKSIYEGNHIMTVVLRTHYALTEETALHFGVEILDLTTGATKAVKVGEHKHFGSDYSSYDFDLSQFIGHDVVIAYGLYWYPGTDGHLPCRRIAFSNKMLEPEEAIGGEKIAGAENFEMFTKENILTMSIIEQTSFTGDNLGHNSGTGDMGVRRVHNPGGQQGYSEFAGTDHIIMYWTYFYVRAAADPIAKEGYTIMSGTGNAAYDNPDSYLVGRFHIGNANDRFRMYVRTQSKYYDTVFRMTAVTDDGVAVALKPADFKADSAKEVTNGCWALKHQRGDGSLKNYAMFEYDLSAFHGKNVALAISAHRGDRGSDCKLAIYRIEMD